MRKPKTRSGPTFPWKRGFVPSDSCDEAAREGGFTLIEIILAVMIIVILLGVAIPAMVGLNEEKKARKPIEELTKLVLEVRERAMERGHPYQIVFDHKGFYATRYFHPFRSPQDFHKHLADLSKPIKITEVVRTEISQTQIQRGGVETPEAPISVTQLGLASSPAAERYVEQYLFPKGSFVSLLFWGDLAWEKVNPQTFRRWVFQPSGVINPLKFRIDFGDTGYFEVHFDPLTGEVMREKSYTQERQDDDEA